jgi:hypothetical protein
VVLTGQNPGWPQLQVASAKDHRARHSERVFLQNPADRRFAAQRSVRFLSSVRISTATNAAERGRYCPEPPPSLPISIEKAQLSEYQNRLRAASAVIDRRYIRFIQVHRFLPVHYRYRSRRFEGRRVLHPHTASNHFFSRGSCFFGALCTSFQFWIVDGVLATSAEFAESSCLLAAALSINGNRFQRHWLDRVDPPTRHNLLFVRYAPATIAGLVIFGARGRSYNFPKGGVSELELRPADRRLLCPWL